MPRVWEKMLATVEIRMADASRLKRAAYRYAMRTGQQLAPQADGAASSARSTALRAALWRARSRCARCATSSAWRACASRCRGAAPIAPQVLECFWALGVPVYEIYGQTENTAVCTFMPADDVRIGTVGKRARRRRAARSPTTARSSPARPPSSRATSATRRRPPTPSTPTAGCTPATSASSTTTGTCTITDRKKDIIITAGGKNISPSEIENKLKVSPYVREAMVVGDRRKYLVALIGVEADTVGDWAARKGVAFTTYGDLARKPEVRELIGEWVEESTATSPRSRRIKRFALLEKELDHEDGELTATQKVKRRALEQTSSTPQIEAHLRVTEFLQLVFAGLALGARYALVALGFVIIYRATGVINFAQGGAGARSAPTSRTRSPTAPGLPFVLAVVARRGRAAALVGAAIERTVLRRMVGQPDRSR